MEAMKNLKVELIADGKTFAETYIPRRLTLATTLHNSHDVTQ